MSPSRSEKYIVLHNPISNEGHLDSWHVLFIKMLAQAGFKIIALTSDPVAIRKKLRDGEQTKAEAFGQEVIVLGAAPVGLLQKLTRRLAHYLTKSLDGLLGRPKRRVTHLEPFILGLQLNALLVRYPKKIGLVLNMYMDAYDPAPEQWQHFRLKTDVPLAGVCITPQSGCSEGYYGLSWYRGTFFLDETWRDAYQAKFTEKYFEYLPDITDTRLPKTPSALLQQILAFSQGRKIVFMGGSIGKQKNLTRWHQAIAASDREQWCFVQVGRINRNNLTEDDEKSLQRLATQPLANLFVHDGYLEDEGIFNEIISHSSVIFAVYRDFNRSSNMLSKAAHFEKPILVSTQGVMGERVQRYKIGLCVNPDMAQEIVSGLSALEQIPNLQENFRLYRDDFSLAVVQAKLVHLIDHCLSTKG